MYEQLAYTDSNSRSLILEFLLLLTDTNGHPDASNGDPVLILDHCENITNSNSLPAPYGLVGTTFLKLNKATNNMRRIAEPYFTYGYLSLNSIRNLLYKRGLVKHRYRGRYITITDNFEIER
ncbi:hypothetical protein pipiens_011764 [Culex pipiens pipiens]|uniref:Uncharacterized protein n=1 Tax=Culex pipiens pipiens TaxID=38569 RepID=A0ABD1D5R0_CULPP